LASDDVGSSNTCCRKDANREGLGLALQIEVANLQAGSVEVGGPDGIVADQDFSSPGGGSEPGCGVHRVANCGDVAFHT
jgi:hypothetical protein